MRRQDNKIKTPDIGIMSSYFKQLSLHIQRDLKRKIGLDI